MIEFVSDLQQVGGFSQSIPVSFTNHGFFRVFWEMEFFVCLRIFHRQKSNFGKITLCSYSINIDVIVYFCLFITTLSTSTLIIRTSIQCHIFISVYLDYWESCIPVIFFYMYPPFFLLKYYCAVIQYHTNCIKSYLCNLQQKNDVTVNLLNGPTIL